MTTDGSPQDLAGRMAAAAAAVEATLDGLLSAEPTTGEAARPPGLVAAMRYAALGGGKRLRPFLTIECARLFGATGEGILRAAAAIELIHAYSLVHDDLPAMDDDDLRRGRPTVHRAFDEATAILAGDGLLTLAFAVLADPATHADADVRVELIASLAAAAGLGGMVGGQALDIAMEHAAPAEAAIRTMQAMKTGALIHAACVAGAILGGPDLPARRDVSRYGRAVGLAFQLADDLLDVGGDATRLGKAAGKDAGRGKATLVALHGVEAAHAMLADIVAEAVRALEGFGPAADTLRATAAFVASRQS